MRVYKKNSMKKENILITGAAGFIGFHLTKLLISENYNIYGLDNINDYYDVNLKYARLTELGIYRNDIFETIPIKSSKYKNFTFIKSNLEDYDFIVEFISKNSFDYVINLAAQAGVRYSIENPRVYLKSNIDGFLSILEGCKQGKIKHLIYASTSSVYGLNTTLPLSENQSTEHPISLYAATKKANEMMAHTYSHLFNLPTTGLRFFTVYGPWGRPDMALFLFTKSILENKPISVFNHGNMIRDFTYVGDIVESIKKLLSKPPTINKNWDTDKPNPKSSIAPYSIYNIGNSNPVPLIEYIKQLEIALGKKATYNFLDIQPGDVPATHADIQDLENYIKFRPQISVKEGIQNFVNWYLIWKNK